MPSGIPAFRRPGPAAPRTSSAARSGPSRLWFTIGFGIVNEVYYPRVDMPQIRDLGFIVADGDGFWSEVKRMRQLHAAAAGARVPAVEIVHQHPRLRCGCASRPTRAATCC